ncbi:MAG: aldo/keto reductase [Oscillospiraceae bacterium]|jgi:aryl-alcohol dehydrogenase-like predicted oxidoreductase|nr:aldo/keto reductase [Oscillospiraceae bacterium]
MKENVLWAHRARMAGITLPQVCFGTEHINRAMPEFGGAILAQAAKLHGVNFWDTDNAYGSITQVAAGLKMVRRDEVVICSKTYGRTPKEAEFDLERALAELGTDYIDIFLLHEVKAGTLPELMPALDVLLKAKERGKIRAVGLSTHCAGVVSAAADVPEIEIVCAPLNRQGSRIEEGTIDSMLVALDKAHNQRGKGVYVIKTLGAGDLVHDVRGSLNWVLDHHHCIDVYNIGVASLGELRENLGYVNAYFDRLERGRDHA